MAKTAEVTQTTISSLLDKASDSFTVNLCANGYVLEISGRNEEGDWRNAKVVCRTESELFDLIREIRFMPRDE